MSIFQAREWWSFTPDPEVDEGKSTSVSIAIRAFPGATRNQSDVIVTGSLSGTVRFFSPFSCDDSGDRDVTFSPANLLLEMQLPEPILKIDIGRLASGLVN